MSALYRHVLAISVHIRKIVSTKETANAEPVRGVVMGSDCIHGLHLHSAPLGPPRTQVF